MAAACRAFDAGRSRSCPFGRRAFRLLLGMLVMLAWLGLPGSRAAQDSHLLVVVGVGGDEEHTDEVQQVGDCGRRRGQEAGRAPTPTSPISASGPRLDPVRIKARSTRDNVTKAVHGHRGAREAGRRSLHPAHRPRQLRRQHGGLQPAGPGPDRRATTSRCSTSSARTRVVFVNTASSSGAFLAPLAGPGRTIVTATRTGGERNEPRFAGVLRRSAHQATARTATATAASRSGKRSSTPS